MIRAKSHRETTHNPNEKPFLTMDLDQFINDLTSRIETALAGVPAVEQSGGVPEVNFAIRSCRQFATEFKTMLGGLKARVKQEAEGRTAELKTALRAELAKDPAWLKASDLMTKADHETAIVVARNDEKSKVDGAVQQQISGMKQMAERRRKAIDDKAVTAVAASAIPDDVFEGEDYGVKLAKVSARLGKLSGIKSLAADDKATKRVASFPVTAEGDAAFEESMEIWQAAAKGGGAPDPLNPPRGGGDARPVLF